MTAIWVALAGLTGVALTALVTYALGRRKASGSVETSEATDLWQAARGLQDAMAGELASARAETRALREEAVALRVESVALREEAVQARRELALVREEARSLRASVAQLEEEVRR